MHHPLSASCCLLVRGAGEVRRGRAGSLLARSQPGLVLAAQLEELLEMGLNEEGQGGV